MQLIRKTHKLTAGSTATSSTPRSGAFIVVTGHHDHMREWFESGAADGFKVMPPLPPQSLKEFVDMVAPELQRRGLYRTESEGCTLRENLGLERPPSRYSLRAKAA